MNMVLDKVNKRYADVLTNLCKWNYTTVVRTHYKLREHIADKKINNLVNSGLVDSAFLTLENDTDYSDRYTIAKPMNHMHLLLYIPNKIKNYNTYKGYFANAINVNIGAVLNIEPVRGRYQITRYVTKHLGMKGSHHNFYSNNSILSNT